MSTPSFARILEIFEKHGVAYVVVGGVAAVLQGAPMTTFDIDTLVKIDPVNVERLAAALAELDARYREHADLKPSREDLAAGGHLLLMTDSGPLDVLGFIGGGRRYEDVANRTVTLTVGTLSLRALSLEALIEDKRALGRDKDYVALRLLEAVQRRRTRA